MGSRIILEKFSIIEDRFTNQHPTLARVPGWLEVQSSRGLGRLQVTPSFQEGAGRIHGAFGHLVLWVP